LAKRRQWLRRVTGSTQVNDTAYGVAELWPQLDQVTRRNDSYFGHEIPILLDVMEQLLERQSHEFQDADDGLLQHVRAKQTATLVVANIVTNRPQWKQLKQVSQHDNEYHS